MPKVDKSIVGIHNKEAVINTIRDNSPIFRAEIARLTGQHSYRNEDYG